MLKANQSKWLPYLIWGCAAFFYVYQFVLRVSPGIIVNDLMASFEINASQVAQLVALSMYSYSLLQIPAGLLTDTYGPRRVLLTSIMMCITGLSLFVLVPNYTVAQMGRLMLGAGSAPAFLCVNKASSEWFSGEMRARLLGFTMAAGTIGAFLGSVSLSYIISKLGWRNGLLSTNLVGFAVLAVVYFVVPKQNENKRTISSSSQGSASLRKTLQSLLVIMKSKQAWVYSWTALGTYLCISVLADLWGVSFISQTYKIEKQSATSIMTLMYVGLCAGSLVLTSMSSRVSKLRIIRMSILLLLVPTVVLIYLNSLPLYGAGALCFLIGFFAGAEMLCFAGLCESYPKELTGTLTGFMNCVVMLGGAFIAEQVGRLLDYFWQGGLHADGLRHYTTLEFQKSLALVPALVLVSWVFSYFIANRTQKLPDLSI